MPVEHIERAILLVRGHKVKLDADLAALYVVETRALIQALKRSMARFTKDFMGYLSAGEYVTLEVTVCDLKAGKARRPPQQSNDHSAVIARGLADLVQ